MPQRTFGRAVVRARGDRSGPRTAPLRAGARIAAHWPALAPRPPWYCSGADAQWLDLNWLARIGDLLSWRRETRKVELFQRGRMLPDLIQPVGFYELTSVRSCGRPQEPWPHGRSE